jgi:hypothetical protein
LTATLQESFSGRREEVLRNLEVQYFVFGAADEDTVRLTCARAPADGGLPASVDGYLLDYYSIEDRLNDTTWRLLAHYKMPPWPNDPPPEGRFSFDTSGGTQHVTQSLATVGRYGPKATDKLQGAIGFDGKNVQGVDITVPVFNFTESHWFTPDKITQAYKLLLFGKTGCYNLDAFRGFALGSVLFLGAAGDRQGDNPDDQWELTFRFAAMPNRTNFQIGNITVASKLGWEYMWVQYDDEADDDNKQIVKKPVAVYIERVYQGTLFSEMGIGT